MKVAEPTIERLVQYYRLLELLHEEGRRVVSSQEMGEMLSLQKTFYPLMKGLMTLDSNPVPIKAALAMRGDIQPGIRLPLVPLAEEKEAQLSALLQRFNIL